MLPYTCDSHTSYIHLAILTDNQYRMIVSDLAGTSQTCPTRLILTAQIPDLQPTHLFLTTCTPVPLQPHICPTFSYTFLAALANSSLTKMLLTSKAIPYLSDTCFHYLHTCLTPPVLRSVSHHPHTCASPPTYLTVVSTPVSPPTHLSLTT